MEWCDWLSKNRTKTKKRGIHMPMLSVWLFCSSQSYVWGSSCLWFLMKQKMYFQMCWCALEQEAIQCSHISELAGGFGPLNIHWIERWINWETIIVMGQYQSHEIYIYFFSSLSISVSYIATRNFKIHVHAQHRRRLHEQIKKSVHEPNTHWTFLVCLCHQIWT